MPVWYFSNLTFCFLNYPCLLNNSTIVPDASMTVSQSSLVSVLSNTLTLCSRSQKKKKKPLFTDLSIWDSLFLSDLYLSTEHSALNPKEEFVFGLESKARHRSNCVYFILKLQHQAPQPPLRLRRKGEEGRNDDRSKQEVSLSAFAFLFSELVQYNQTQVDNIAELERRLEDAGYAVGARVLELLCHRDKGNRRETRLLGILSFVHSTVWKVLFGKVADSLEKGTEHEDEYMISEKELLVNRFISIPKDMGTFNCGAFVAGIVRGVLDSAGFPAVVTAHFVPMEGQQRPRTTILIKFAEEVLRREARLG
ncbi:hypothetical protein NE237_008134 [Protea cynaroides]|uniref:Trafficking protein particle complex subunit n=2 Tax=Mesangiospermae TaxID=1437183 RepID=A0A9Q0KQS9_9MAGN|nr:hypothetical protein NE237_008134 [Protea cynaroides]